MKRDFVCCPHCNNYDEKAEDDILEGYGLVEEDWRDVVCSNCGGEYQVLPECHYTFDTKKKP